MPGPGLCRVLIATRNIFRPIDGYRPGIVLTVLNRLPLSVLAGREEPTCHISECISPFVLMRNSAQFLKAAYEGARLCRVSGESDLRFERQRAPERDWPFTSLGIVRDPA